MQNDFEKFLTNFDIVENALDMRDLRRWNGRSLRREENLSEHTHLVVACAIKLYDEYKNKVNINFEELIKKAILHDGLEILRGDILSTTKDAIPGLRNLVDNEENEFIKKVLKYDNLNTLEDDLVKLADAMACYKFIERELTYPSNDFSHKAFERCKNVYGNKMKEFLQKHVNYS